MVTDNSMEARTNALQISQLTSIQEIERIKEHFIG